MQNDDAAFDKISAKVTQPKNKKNPFQAVIPEVTGFNQKVIKGGAAVIAVIFCLVIYDFVVPDKKEKNEEKASQTTHLANNLEGGPKNYTELKEFNKHATTSKNKNLEKQNIEVNKGYYSSPPNNPPIRSSHNSGYIPNANPPGIPMPNANYDSPLQFDVASSQSGSTNQTDGAAANVPDFRQNVRGNKDFYNPATVEAPISPYEVKAGTIIPSVLITGINSDLPGIMIAQVTENLFDTVSGRYLLIPQGTKLIGEYNSDIQYGQERVQVIWSRLIMPNGDSLDLNGAIGADTSGYSGISGRTNNHDNRLINGGLVTSAFAVLIGTQTKNSTSESNSDPASIVAENMSQIADKIVSRGMDVKPTIEIEPGTRFNILVDQDLLLRPYRSL